MNKYGQKYQPSQSYCDDCPNYDNLPQSDKMYDRYYELKGYYNFPYNKS